VRGPGRSLGRGGGVFLDTSGLIALVNAVDAAHGHAHAAFDLVEAEGGRVFTSDWVLAEFLSSCARRPPRGAALAAVDAARSSDRTTVIGADRATFDDALTLFRERGDKEWSLVDCTTIVLCGLHGVGRVLTSDRHFAQAGLEPLLPLRPRRGPR
jgi:predicted nucleic acid-binding protein